MLYLKTVKLLTYNSLQPKEHEVLSLWLHFTMTCSVNAARTMRREEALLAGHAQMFHAMKKVSRYYVVLHPLWFWR